MNRLDALTAPLLARYQELSDREQRLVQILLPIVVLVLLLALWWGLHKATTKAAQHYNEQRQLQVLMLARASDLAGARPAAASDEPLMLLVSRSAASQQLSLTRQEPEGDNGVRVSFEQASFAALASWLNLLQQAGLNVSEAQIDAREGAPGQVSARLVLSR